MILEFEVKNPSKTHIKWMESVVPKPKKFVFSPGLNILVGPNGSGKSTIISAISSLLQCQQGGVQKVTRMSVLDLFQRILSRRDICQNPKLKEAGSHKHAASRLPIPNMEVGRQRQLEHFDIRERPASRVQSKHEADSRHGSPCSR